MMAKAWAATVAPVGTLSVVAVVAEAPAAAAAADGVVLWDLVGAVFLGVQVQRDEEDPCQGIASEEALSPDVSVRVIRYSL